MVCNKKIHNAAFALIIAAPVAYAGVGSVISSFRVVGLCLSAHRDTNYVYEIEQGIINRELIIYEPDGRYAGEVMLDSWQGVLADADHSYAGYKCISVAGEACLVTYSKRGGPALDWRHGDGINEVIGYAYLPGSPFYFVGTVPDGIHEPFTVSRYSTAGEILGSFIPAYRGALAATNEYDGKAGEYLITVASHNPSAVYTPEGSLIATFTIDINPPLGSSTVGAGYPASYGPTLWASSLAGYGQSRVYQIDLGNGVGSGVTPASLGRVKALFK